jgi:hypothetical protein
MDDENIEHEQRRDITVDVLLEQTRRANERAARFQRMFEMTIIENRVLREQYTKLRLELDDMYPIGMRR